MYRFEGGLQSLDDNSTRFRRQLAMENNHAVVVVIPSETSLLLLCLCLIVTVESFNPLVFSHQFFHMAGGAIARNL